jgi:hypothetical protein
MIDPRPQGASFYATHTLRRKVRAAGCLLDNFGLVSGSNLMQSDTDRLAACFERKDNDDGSRAEEFTLGSQKKEQRYTSADDEPYDRTAKNLTNWASICSS